MREMKQQQQPKKTNSNNNEGYEAANKRGRNKMGCVWGRECEKERNAARRMEK
jgi:hypothetical protein